MPSIFEFGVASGDPFQDRVILWTRVPHAMQVSWEVAQDKDRPFLYLSKADKFPSNLPHPGRFVSQMVSILALTWNSLFWENYT